jgi:hypothetical protein
LGLFFHSYSDGKYGGQPGLAHKVYEEATSVNNEPGDENEGKPIYGDITDPATGRLVNIVKSKAEGAQYPSYSFKIGSKSAPVQELMDKLDDGDYNAIQPLERVLDTVEYEEEKAILREYIGEDYFKKIFG